MLFKTVILVFFNLFHLFFAELIDNEDDGVGVLIEGDIQVDTNFDPEHENDASNENEQGHANAHYNQNVQPNPWPNGVIPYKFASRFSESSKKLIIKMMGKIENSSCVQFRHHSSEDTYMQIRRGSYLKPCNSFIGYKNDDGARTIYLHNSCINENDILHELMHALGFFHEHNRHDRDKFIRIQYSNIKENASRNFDIRDIEESVIVGFHYDYESVTHYPRNAFAKDISLPTIISRYGQEIKANGLSEVDIKKINKFYDCTRHTETTSRLKSETHAANSSACKFNFKAENRSKHFHSHEDFGKSNYWNNVFCEWTIRSLAPTRIMLTFDSFDLATTSSGNCTSDRIEIFYGNLSDLAVPQKEILCGNKVCRYHQALNRHIRYCTSTFTLTTSLLLEASKYFIKQSMRKHVNIRSHIGYGLENYSNNMVCYWTVRAVSSKRTWIVIEEFELESSALCTYDYLKIFTSRGSTNGTTVSKICGSYDKERIISEVSLDDTIQLQFRTDVMTTRKGFQFSYFSTPVGSFSSCESTLTADHNVRLLHSHVGFPLYNYESNTRCSWTIHADENKRVRLLIPFLHLEHYTCYDYLEVYDGTNESAIKIGKFCRIQAKRVIVSTDQSLHLKFRTDSVIEERGFWLAYFSI